jgi:cytochrome c551/c552
LKVRALLPLFLFAGGCKPPPDQQQFMPLASAERGRAAIVRVGCGSCHSIEGIDWPRGRVGPSLHDYAQRGLIAGHLPNRPELLAAYIRNAPALVPNSGMPAMPVSEREARDIAAFLYRPDGR